MLTFVFETQNLHFNMSWRTFTCILNVSKSQQAMEEAGSKAIERPLTQTKILAALQELLESGALHSPAPAVQVKTGKKATLPHSVLHSAKSLKCCFDLSHLCSEQLQEPLNAHLSE